MSAHAHTTAGTPYNTENTAVHCLRWNQQCSTQRLFARPQWTEWAESIPDLQGCTALHMAAHQGHGKAVCWLAKPGGADVDAVDSNGRTALHHAAALGHVGVVQALWARGCSVQAEDVHGWTGAAGLPALCSWGCARWHGRNSTASDILYQHHYWNSVVVGKAPGRDMSCTCMHCSPLHAMAGLTVQSCRPGSWRCLPN